MVDVLPPRNLYRDNGEHTRDPPTRTTPSQKTRSPAQRPLDHPGLGEVPHEEEHFELDICEEHVLDLEGPDGGSADKAVWGHALSDDEVLYAFLVFEMYDRGWGVVNGDATR